MRAPTKTTKEVERAAFQLPRQDIMWLFLHLNDGGTVEYRVENFRGKVLRSQLNPRAGFESWVLKTIKEML